MDDIEKRINRMNITTVERAWLLEQFAVLNKVIEAQNTGIKIAKDAIHDLKAEREWIPVRIKPELRDTAYLCKIGPSPYYVQIRFFRLTGEWNDPNVISWMQLPIA